MKRIIVSGTHDDMGKQQGERAVEDIAWLYKNLVQYKILKKLKPWYVPLGFFEKRFFKSFIEKFVPILEVIPGTAERFGGIASGAKLHLGVLSFLHSFESAQPTGNLPVFFSSTLIFLSPEKTKTGQSMVLYNLYGPDIMERNVTLRISHPQGKFSSIELTLDFMTGSFIGMNEKGIFVGYTPVFSQESGKNGPLLSTVIQRVLEECETLECALDLISDFDYPNSANVLLSRETKAYTLEISPSRKKLIKIIDKHSVLTNHFTSEEMTPLNLEKEATFDKSYPEGLNGKSIIMPSYERHERAQELLTRKDKLTVEDAVTIMKDHGRDFIPSYDTICAHAEGYGTIMSGIFLPSEGSVLFVSGKPCRSKYKEVKLQV